ncbi:MAG: hypothetical protein KDJ29_19195, partial [Hyphomicrobiales bacterium]|nr:hypothetical protein [Hyphomicrobiales bacterium]
MTITNEELWGLRTDGRGILADYVGGVYRPGSSFVTFFTIYDDDPYAIKGDEKGDAPIIVTSLISSLLDDGTTSIFDVETVNNTYVLDVSTMQFGTVADTDSERVNCLMFSAPDPDNSSVEIRFFLFEIGTQPQIDRDSFETKAHGKPIEWSDFMTIPVVGSDAKETFKDTEDYERFFGLDGADRFVVGGKNTNQLAPFDRFDGGSGSDTIDFRKVSKAISFELAEANALGRDNDFRFFYESIENIVGSKFGDEIEGNSEPNNIAGGKGKDSISGGDGSDIFLFKTKDGRDTIYDFTTAGDDRDVVDISKLHSVKNWNDLKHNHLDAYSDEARHPFRNEAGHPFPFHPGHHSHLKPPSRC